jgi:DNA adenine methylase
MKTLIPYIGGKHRIAAQLAVFLHATGAETIVDVFGGSGAVVMNCGFRKRIYNDADGDLVNMFRVLANDVQRASLLRRLRQLPMARQIFEDDYRGYLRNGFSFAYLADPVERARATFYRQHCSFGGKTRSGGFTCSTGDRGKLKEAYRYRNALRRMVELATFWRETVIENLHYSEAITMYGRRPGVVLFCDPPYVETENIYSHRFTRADHTFLAHQLAEAVAPCVCTYYDHPLIRSLYPEDRWSWTGIESTKNMQRFKGGVRSDAHWKGTVGKVTEWVLTRKVDGKAPPIVGREIAP